MQTRALSAIVVCGMWVAAQNCGMVTVRAAHLLAWPSSHPESS